MKSYTDVAARLAHRAITNHKSKEVQLLGACCLSDIMRIFAPNPPYSHSQLKQIFNVFFTQLRGLADTSSPQFSRHYHLLESLTQVSTFLVLLEFPEEEQDKSVVRLFRLLFNLCKEDLSIRVEKYFVEIFGQFLKELEQISPALLDSMMINLVPPFVEANPAAFQLTCKVLQDFEMELERPIVQFVTDIMLGKEVESEIESRDKQLKLIYVLLVQQPQLLSATVMQLQQLMEVEDEEERLENITMFGDVFSSSGTKRTSPIYQQLFANLVKRCGDVSTDVRRLMAELLEDYLVNRVEFREHLSPWVNKLLIDRDDRVRKTAVHSLCQAGLIDPEILSPEILQNIAERSRDRREGVRQTALTGLAKLFKHHCSESWKLCRGLPIHAKRFSFIPRKLMSVLRSVNNQNSTQALIPFMDQLMDQVSPQSDPITSLSHVIHVRLRHPSPSLSIYLYSSYIHILR